MTRAVCRILTDVCNSYSVNMFYAFVVPRRPSPWGPVRIARRDGPRRGRRELLSSAEGFAAGRWRGEGSWCTEADAGTRRRRSRHEAAIAIEAFPGRRARAARHAAGGHRTTGRPGTGWCWARSRRSPRGAVASYGEVARRIGRTGAARAVGGAVGRNPVGLLIPCHRVIAGDGSLGGYGAAAWGGREAALDVKRALLALEGVLDLGGEGQTPAPGASGRRRRRSGATGSSATARSRRRRPPGGLPSMRPSAGGRPTKIVNRRPRGRAHVSSPRRRCREAGGAARASARRGGS